MKGQPPIKRFIFLTVCTSLLLGAISYGQRLAGEPRSRLAGYVRMFNAADQETVKNAIDNDSAAAWMAATIPHFECSDPAIERTYYFRWWVFRKHLKRTPVGYVITEFLPPVPWAGTYNTISCPAGHHFYEGRWLRNPVYVQDYAYFWFRRGGQPRLYSFWAADAFYQTTLVHPNPRLTADLLPDLINNYQQWEQTNRDSTGLYWQIDDRDGMEVSIGGSGYRATINSYQYGDARAIAALAHSVGKPAVARQYQKKAEQIKTQVQARLWDEQARFFKVLPRGRGQSVVSVRELHGYVPWYFNLPDQRYAVAWRYLMDTTYFRAPYGLTSAERGHPQFLFQDPHECTWNGPSWPFATTQTLVALANLLTHPGAYPFVGLEDYYTLFRQYTASHQLTRPDGNVVPWIDENLDPFRGDWLSRRILQSTSRPDKDRGKDYNHSAYADLLITGLLGLRPRADELIELHPLLPAGAWSYFRITNLPYHGRLITIQYDRTGARYKQGKGLSLWADGRLLKRRSTLGQLLVPLP